MALEEIEHICETIVIGSDLSKCPRCVADKRFAASQIVNTYQSKKCVVCENVPGVPCAYCITQLELHRLRKDLDDLLTEVHRLREESADAAFWKEQCMRALCGKGGCVSLDCRRHGAYAPEDADRVLAAREEDRKR